MDTPHCCDPHHRTLAERLRRMTERAREAETRARWAETTEAVLADEVERLRELLGLRE